MKELSELSSGDLVFIAGHGMSNPRIYEVERTTKTMIVLKNGSRYRKDTGFAIGRDVWNVDRIEPATDKHVKQVKDHRKRLAFLNKIQGFNWRSLSLQDLEKVCSVITDSDW